MGAYHTLDLELQRKFTLQKNEWDSVALERIGNTLLIFHCNFCVGGKDNIQCVSRKCNTYYWLHSKKAKQFS